MSLAGFPPHHHQEMSSEESSAHHPPSRRKTQWKAISVECFIYTKAQTRGGGWRPGELNHRKIPAFPSHTCLKASFIEHTLHLTNVRFFTVVLFWASGLGLPLSEGNEGNLHHQAHPSGQLSLCPPSWFPGAPGIWPHQQPVATHTLQGNSCCQLHPSGAGKCHGTAQSAVGASLLGSGRPPLGP